MNYFYKLYKEKEGPGTNFYYPIRRSTEYSNAHEGFVYHLNPDETISPKEKWYWRDGLSDEWDDDVYFKRVNVGDAPNKTHLISEVLKGEWIK